MDDMKDKVKGFMKKVNNPFSSSSSGKFKGQGRVLGSSSSGPSNPIFRPSQAAPSKQTSSSISSSASANSKPLPQKVQSSDQSRSVSSNNPNPNPERKQANGFDPFDSLITSGKRNRNGYTLEVLECPICGQSFRSEGEVSEHVDSCLNKAENNVANGSPGSSNNGAESSQSDLEACVGTFLSGKPSAVSVEVVLRLLRNIVKEPENGKFRKIRMSNPKIREAIGDVPGGIELLEFVGFELLEEDGEMWASLEIPSGEKICVIKKTIELIEPQKVQEFQKITNLPSAASVDAEENVEPKKVDRQVR